MFMLPRVSSSKGGNECTILFREARLGDLGSIYRAPTAGPTHRDLVYTRRCPAGGALSDVSLIAASLFEGRHCWDFSTGTPHITWLHNISKGKMNASYFFFFCYLREARLGDLGVDLPGAHSRAYTSGSGVHAEVPCGRGTLRCLTLSGVPVRGTTPLGF